MSHGHTSPPHVHTLTSTRACTCLVPGVYTHCSHRVGHPCVQIGHMLGTVSSKKEEETLVPPFLTFCLEPQFPPVPWDVTFALHFWHTFAYRLGLALSRGTFWLIPCLSLLLRTSAASLLTSAQRLPFLLGSQADPWWLWTNIPLA